MRNALQFNSADVFFTALISLVIVLILSLFIERPWCRWLCPFGVLLGIVQRGELALQDIKGSMTLKELRKRI